MNLVSQAHDQRYSKKVSFTFIAYTFNLVEELSSVWCKSVAEFYLLFPSFSLVLCEVS